MKTQIKNFVSLLAIVSLFFLASCNRQNQEVTPQENQPTASTATASPSTNEPYGDGSFEDPAMRGARTSAAAPTITSVNGSLGFGTYATSLAVDSDGQDLLGISGSGFGTARGSVSLLNVSSYSITSITSWSDKFIQVRVSSNYNSVPAPSALNNNVSPTMQITTASGVRATRNVRLVPRITTKQYAQCTWWANKRRAENGRSIQGRGAAYSTSYPTINANYVPQAGDILIWHNAHQAYTHSVTTTTGAWNSRNQRDITYRLLITEYNIKPEAFSDYNTTVTVRETRATNGTITRQIVSGLYRSGYASQAGYYFR